MASANSIKVVARFRPQNKVELASGGEPIVTFNGPDTCTLNVRLPPYPAKRPFLSLFMLMMLSLSLVSRGCGFFYIRSCV